MAHIASPMHFATTDYNSHEESAQQSNLLVIAVPTSLLLHLLIATFFIQSEHTVPKVNTPQLVAINLLPTNPNKPLEQAPKELVLPPAATEQAVVEQAAAEETLKPGAAVGPRPIADLRDLAGGRGVDAVMQINALEVESSQATGVDDAVSRSIPSVDSISRSVRKLSRSSEAQFYSTVCNPLEEEERLKECALKPNASYAELEVNAIYQAFNPAQEISRSAAVSAVVSSQAQAVASRLRSELPQGLSGYLIEELEAGISHSVNEGNRAVQHMIDMTDKSSAAAQARQVLGNPLLIDLKRAQRNPTRGVLISPP
jgi:hypothetical protein